MLAGAGSGARQPGVQLKLKRKYAHKGGWAAGAGFALQPRKEDSAGGRLALRLELHSKGLQGQQGAEQDQVLLGAAALQLRDCWLLHERGPGPSPAHARQRVLIPPTPPSAEEPVFFVLAQDDLPSGGPDPIIIIWGVLAAAQRNRMR